jgi:fructokinase
MELYFIAINRIKGLIKTVMKGWYNMCDFLSIGELLIDFTPSHLSTTDRCFLEGNPGGAPANVAVQLSVLGISSGFIGKVGDDIFGKFLKRTLDSYNVSTAGLILDQDFLTTLAFVNLDENGDRDFVFYRNPGADTQLQIQEVNFDLVDNCKILHFGSLSFTEEPIRSTSI